ncbi:HesA/MoeB/ThiF family protein, partial [Comamonas kerstersii]|uniref:HesA/MoeB/ThiF family protein n=2 Tax=Bacteria TaxID=2 RepID=UPI000A6503DE
IEVSNEEVLELINDFSKENIVHKHFENSYKDNKYSRQIEFFNNYYDDNGIEIQKKLENKKVAILGLGGIGSWIITNIIMSGIKNIVLVDPDLIEESNLTRQNLYTLEDLGQYKVDVMERKIRAISSDLNIQKSKNFIENKKALKKIIYDSDFVISCIDKPSILESGTLVSDVCFEMKIPHIISGGYNGHQGFIGPTLIPGKTVCWRCINDEIEKQYEDWHSIVKAKAIGTLGTLSSIIAGIQSWECIQHLIDPDIDSFMQGKKGEFDFSNLSIKVDDFSKNRECNICN